MPNKTKELSVTPIINYKFWSVLLSSLAFLGSIQELQGPQTLQKTSKQISQITQDLKSKITETNLQ